MVAQKHKNRQTKRRGTFFLCGFFVLLFLSGVLLSTAKAQAATICWTGGTSTAWATGSNWVGGVAPANDATTDIACFNQTSYTNLPTIGNASRSVAGIVIGDGSTATATLTIASGGGTRILTVGASGVDMKANAGAVTISAPVTLGAAQTWQNASSNLLRFSGAVANGGFLLTIGGAGNITISSVVSGTGGITKNGAGTLTLSNTNTYTGLTTLNAGTLSVGAARNYGAAGNDITFGGGTLKITAGFTANSGTIFTTNAASTGTINVDSGQTLTLGTATTNVASTNSTLIKSGSGTLTISAAQTTFDGTLQVDAGTLIISGSTSVIGDTTNRATLALNGGTVSINDSTARAFSANLSVTASSTAVTNRAAAGAGVTHSFNSTSLGAFTLSVNGGANVTSGTAQLTLNALTLTGNGTINTTIPAGGGTTKTSIMTVGGNTYNLAIGGTGDTDITGIISTTSGSLTKDDTGTLTLSGANTFTGGLTIHAGTVTGSTSASAFGNSGSGTITLGDTSGSANATLLVSTTGLNYANPVTLATGTSGTLSMGNTGTAISTTFSGGVTGTNNLTINSNATSGTITFSTADINNTGTVTNIGAGSGTTTVSSNIGSNVTTLTENSSTAALSITGTATVGAITVTAGTLSVSNSVTVSSATSVTGTFTIASATGTKTFGNVTINNGGTWNNTATNEDVSIGGNLQNDGTLNAGTGVYTFTGTTKTISGANTVTIPSVAVSGTYTNNGTLTVATALTGSGTLTQGTNSTLNIAASDANFTMNTLAASASGNTVNYNGSGAQTIKAVNYYHLTGSASSVSASDNFNRANANPIGGNWTTITGLSALQIVGNQAVDTASLSQCGAYWNADTFSSDQYSEVTRYYGSSGDDNWPVVRAVAGHQTFYTFDTGNFITRYNDGTPTTVGAAFTGLTASLVSGDIIRLSITGSTLTLYVNGVSQGSRTDGSPIPSGQPGMFIWVSSTGTNPLDNWSAGDNASSGSRTLASSGTIGVAGTFTPGSSSYTITGSTVDFNGSGSQTIPAFNYNNLTSSNSGARTLASAPSNWYNASWTYRRRITFGNNFSGAGTLTNFPVMIALDSSRIDYGNTQNAGQDIRFTDSDGTTLLPYEIETWNESGTSTVWVKVPQIDNSATDYIYVYYGNASASDAQSKTSVWNNGQINVWHFGEGSGTTTSDSTSTGNTGTLTNGPTWTAGINGNGISFDGVDDRITLSSFDAGTVNSFTTWIYWNDSGDGVVFGNTASNGYFLYADATNVYYSTGGTNYVTVAHGGLSGGWHQISISRNGTSVSFYKDGTQVGTTQTLGTNATITNVSMGSYSDGTFPTQAILDEVRAYSTSLSATEIGADWRSTADTFNTYSTQENATNSIGIAGTFTPGTNAYTITGSTVDFNGSGSQTIPAFDYNNLTNSSTGARVLANSGIIGVASTFTPGSNSYTVTGSTMNFNGSSAQTVNASFTYNHLQVKPSANSVTTNFAAGTVTVNGDLTIGNGTNTSVVVNANNASTTLTVLGSVSISANTTLQANASNNFTISDDFTNNGTFTHNNGTVVFNDNTKTSSLNYSADTTFYNLSVTTGGKATQFDEAQKTTVTHTLTITGTDCTTGRIFLDSVVDNNQWDITVTGATVSISYADVEDANAVTTAITTSNSTADNDNNTNWTISGGVCGGNANPDVPASLTQKNSSDVTISESAWTSSNTPKLGFTITDPDSGNTVKYRVQVATDSGFSSLVLDYTHGSLSASGTTFTFVIGTYTGGTCTGTCPATLSDSSGGYWWRVKAIDNSAAESAFVEPGVAGTVDFKVDATAPTGGSAYDGTSGDQDWNDGSLTSISGNWTGIDATVSGVQKYEYAIRRKPDDYYWSVCSGSGSWQAGALWCDNTTSTSFTQNTLNLATGVTYYISVRTTDNAGNVGTAINSNGQHVLPMLSFSLSGNTVAFSNLNVANSYTDTKTITTTTSTNAANGYTIKVYNTDFLRASPSITIPDFSGTWSSPATWSGGQYGFGYTSDDTSVQGSNRFSGGTAFAAFSQSPPGDVVADHTTAVDGSTGSVSSEHFTITYKVAASTSQDALYYQTSSIFIVTANY